MPRPKAYGGVSPYMRILMNTKGLRNTLWRAAFLSMAVTLLVISNALCFTIELRQRDPQTGKITLRTEDVDPRRVGVVVVDVWNFHWCKTSTERVAALVPRMNKVLDQARRIGMTVFLCPTDVADNYVGTPMVERVLAIEPATVPHLRDIQCPAAPDGGGCTCGAERCLGNYGWDGMCPDLVIGADDLMPNDAGRLYAICQQRGLTHLLFVGFHTQVCLLGKSIGLRAMLEAGFKCALARDLTDAHGRYVPGGETPDDFTAKVVTHFEKYLSPTFDFADTLRRNQHWDDSWQVDMVHHSPWGTHKRAHLFERECILTLTYPQDRDAEIRFTQDGTEPTGTSSRYTAPLKFTNTTTIRAAAFKNGRRVSLVSDSFVARLLPTPPSPDVYLGDVKPWRAVGMGHSPSFNDHRLSPGVNSPQTNKSNEGKPIKLHGIEYARGIGVHAPNQLVYDLQPEWEAFVARAGVDEHVLDTSNGSNRAMHPTVVFRVFIDGQQVAESPIMRIAFEPWRFSVPIPKNSKRISLIATDAGDGHYMDLANWANAGFVLKKRSVAATPPPRDE
jgi:nicotinamidase-related amidase